jgi:hypothetical protein
MTNEELVAEFAECVAAQSREADPEIGNEYARRYVRAFEALRAVGDTGRDALAALFVDPRPKVRVMAASFLLRHSSEKARRVLEEVAAGKGLVALSAKQALEKWADGTWELDPE